jgi:hypothetical protein
MHRLFDDFCDRHPLLYMLLIALGGAMVIVAVLGTLFFFLGGIKLMRTLGIVSVVFGLLWFFPHYLKARTTLFRHELYDRFSEERNRKD